MVDIMNEKEIIERAKTLLKAYVDMFNKQHESSIVKDITESIKHIYKFICNRICIKM